MIAKTIKPLMAPTAIIPKDELLVVTESTNLIFNQCYKVVEGPFKGVHIPKTLCIIQKEKTYTEQEYTHIMDLLDREREKNDRLVEAVLALIKIIYKKTFPGVIE